MTAIMPVMMTMTVMMTVHCSSDYNGNNDKVRNEDLMQLCLLFLAQEHDRWIQENEYVKPTISFCIGKFLLKYTFHNEGKIKGGGGGLDPDECPAYA